MRTEAGPSVATISTPSISAGPEIGASIGFTMPVGGDIARNTPSLSPIESSGGMHIPDFHPSIAAMPELSVGSTDAFDRVVPGSLAFTHTKVLARPVGSSAFPGTPDTLADTVPLALEALPQSDTRLRAFRTEEFGVLATNESACTPNIPQETALKAEAASLLAEVVTVHKPQEKEDLSLTAHPLPDENEEEEKRKKKKNEISEELYADALQAVRVQKAREALGEPGNLALQKTVRAFEEVVQKRISPALQTERKVGPILLENETTTAAQHAVAEQPATRQSVATLAEPEILEDVKQQVKIQKGVENEETTEKKQKRKISVTFQRGEEGKIIFERDPDANQNRHDLGIAASRTAFEHVGRRITGADVAAIMPEKPQPVSAKSKLVLQMFDGVIFPDGSYDDVVENIRHSGTIYSLKHAEQIVDRAIDYATAVRTNVVPITEPVTIKEVNRVLRGKTNSIKDLLAA